MSKPSDNLITSAREASILIVDDEPANLKLLQRMLSTMGYKHLHPVQDPRQVLEQYRTHHPHLILLDLNMPYMDGFAVLRQLHGLDDPQLPPVIMLTAQSGREYRLRALNEGARDFISKPFDIAELQARVRNLLDAYMAHRLVHEQKDVLDDLVRQRTEELRHMQFQVLERLGRAAEFRDNETGRHITRVRLYSRYIAESLGWSREQCDLIEQASPMHDIGKIGVPDHILLKPGRLTDDEFDAIKKHPQIGADLLDGDNSQLMRMAYSIALTHHEKWDGSGYPRGLAGDAIPMEGRIVAIADVFDALTSERPYKKAWRNEDAIELIRSGAGSHFDPTLVEHFLTILPRVLDTQNRYRDENQ